MSSKQTDKTKESDSTNLRRSTRSTRGSIKPVIDLSRDEIEPDLDVKEEDEHEEEFIATTTRRESRTRKSSVKAEPKKKEPVKRKPANKGAAKQETKETIEAESVKTESTNHNSGERDELADDDDDGTHYELSEIELKEINHAFDMNRLSDTGDELMNSDGLRTAIRSLGFEPRGDEIKRLMKNYSKKGGKVSRDGFHKIMAFKFGSSPGAKLNNLNDEISRVFNLLDLDKTGFITLENLKSISKELNEDLTEDDLNEMISEADLDGDLMINKQEFENIMKKTSLY